MKRIFLSIFTGLFLLACASAQTTHKKSAKIQNEEELSALTVPQRFAIIDTSDDGLIKSIPLADVISLLNISSGNLTQEEVEDIIGNLIVNGTQGSNVSLVYNDNGVGAGSLDLAVVQDGNDFPTGASLVGNTLTLTIPNQSDVSIDLSTLSIGPNGDFLANGTVPMMGPIDLNGNDLLNGDDIFADKSFQFQFSGTTSAQMTGNSLGGIFSNPNATKNVRIDMFNTGNMVLNSDTIYFPDYAAPPGEFWYFTVTDTGLLSITPSAGGGGAVSDGSITNVKLADDAVSGAKILDGTITTADIQDNAINGDSDIQDASITASKIANDAILTDNVLDNAITGDKIFDGTITTVDIQDNGINGSSDIQNASITASKIADNAILTANVLNNAITGDKILDGTITTMDIQDNGINGTQDIQDASIDIGKISPNGAEGLVIKQVSGNVVWADDDIGTGSLTTEQASRNANIRKFKPNVKTSDNVAWALDDVVQQDVGEEAKRSAYVVLNGSSYMAPMSDSFLGNVATLEYPLLAYAWGSTIASQLENSTSYQYLDSNGNTGDIWTITNESGGGFISGTNIIVEGGTVSTSVVTPSDLYTDANAASLNNEVNSIGNWIRDDADFDLLVATNIVHSGTYSFKVDVTLAGDSSQSVASSVIDGVTAGDNVTLGFWVYSEAGNVTIRLNSTDFTYSGTGTTFITTYDTWIFVELTGVANVDNGRVEILNSGTNANHEYYFDEMTASTN